MGNMRFKVGDRVRIKSLDWYNENKDKYGYIDCGSRAFFTKMSDWCGKIATIKEICKTNYYHLEEYDFDWTDEMIEGLVEEENKPKPKFKVGDRVITNKGYIGKFEGWVSDYQVRVLFEESGCNVVIHPKDLKLAEEETKPNVIEEAKTYWDSIKDAWICPEGYIFKDENGNVINATKIVLEKKKKEYPKTFLGCCDVLGIEDLINRGVNGYRSELLDAFQKLLICRDAYWQMAGEEMGLGKPWETDWIYQESPKYCIANVEGQVKNAERYIINTILSFPTEEMRDAFYEVFKKEIELVKELL